MANLFSLYPTLKTGAAPLYALFLYFPIAIARRLSAWNGGEPPPLAYQPGLCHRCNSVMPRLRYCDPEEGSDLMQKFGWYVNQAYLHFGMLPYGGIFPASGYLPGSERELEAARAAEMAFQSECARLLDLLYPDRQGASVGDNGPRIPQPGQLSEMLSLREHASAARHNLKLRIEAIVRGQLQARG